MKMVIVGGGLSQWGKVQERGMPCTGEVSELDGVGVESLSHC
jgi:hypothetical protein